MSSTPYVAYQSVRQRLVGPVNGVSKIAFGPGSQLFNGVMDNTDIGILIAKLLRIEDFPAIHP